MMEVWFTDRVRLVLLVGFCGLLASVESLVPLLRFRRGRLRRALPNFALAAGVFLINFALASVAASLSALVVRNGIGLLAPLRAHLWPLLIAGVVVLDLSGYVAHLLMHKIPLGWKFHQVHHSELEVDVTTAFRQHPGETLCPMHKIHHSRVVMESDSNYSNIFSIWDRIFGTYTGHSNQQVIVYGLDGCEKPQDRTLSGLLGTPFRSS